MEFNIIFFTIVAGNPFDSFKSKKNFALSKVFSFNFNVPDIVPLVLLHITGSNLVFTWDSSGKNNQNDDQHENSLSSGGSFEKRQLVPMPR